jgi:hypothetical protein
MKRLTIAVANSKNYIDYSILSGKSEIVESRFGFRGIECYRDLFKWLKYPSQDLSIVNMGLSIHFLSWGSYFRYN